MTQNEKSAWQKPKAILTPKKSASSAVRSIGPPSTISASVLKIADMTARYPNGRDPAEKEGHPYFQTDCIVCGKPFWPTGPNTKICSDVCRKDRNRQQMKEFHKRQKEKEQSAEIISIVSALPEKELQYAQG